MKLVQLILFIPFLLSCSSMKNSKIAILIEMPLNKNEFIEVRIDDGIAAYGFSSINLTVDGLICNIGGKVFFIKIHDIDLKALIRLQNYLKYIDAVSSLESSVSINDLPSPSPIRIFLSNGKRNVNLVRYNVCNVSIDKMIILLIELLPEEYRKDFRFALLCQPD